MNALWDQLARAANLSFTSEHALLERYLELLLRANATMNLTRIDDLASARVGHVGDALTLLPFIPAGPQRLADVGSGGGVPGIPLAIARPDLDVFLIESTRKKAAFLAETAVALGLPNISIVADRAETIARAEHRESFDIVVARALAPMGLLAEWCVPLLKIGGRLLAMKGGKLADELPVAEKALRILGASPPVVHPVDLPGAEQHRILESTKLAPTDPRYPRSVSIAKKKPL